MQCTKNSHNIKRNVQQLLKKYSLIDDIVASVVDTGGRALLVGGAVRDLFLHQPIKDVDIEVHGVPADILQDALKAVCHVEHVGKSFGVFKCFKNRDFVIDVSLPRTDSSGRKPDVTIDPYMGVADAFRRRDVTMNAMGVDLSSYELIDPFNGLIDLKNTILRAVDSDFFAEDPLRLYRVMQFISRFAMKPDEQLNQICRTMDVSSVSLERVEDECEKLLLKSIRPSLGFRWLHAIGRLQDLMPELAATVGVMQNPKWHPEGDVFEHTMQVIDAAAALDYSSEKEKLTVLYASLCHDLGKVTTTREVDGSIVSYGHEREGVPLAHLLLKRLTGKKDIIAAVAILVRYHMHPLQFLASGAKPPAYKRLAKKISPRASCALLAKLARADRLGRNGISSLPLTGPVKDVDFFEEKVKALRVLHSSEEPVLLGRNIIDSVGSGKQMGDLLRRAYEIQISEEVRDAEVLKERVLAKIKKE